MDCIADSVFVFRFAAWRQPPFQKPDHGILASGQLAGDLNPRLKVRAFVAVECRRVPAEFGEERLEREGVVPCLHHRAQLFLRHLPCPLPRLGPFACLTAATLDLGLHLPFTLALFGVLDLLQEDRHGLFERVGDRLYHRDELAVLPLYPFVLPRGVMAR